MKKKKKNKGKKDNMSIEKENKNINIIKEPFYKKIELDENSYLLFVVGTIEFSIFINTNDKFRYELRGKSLKIYNYKPTIENTTSRYYLATENHILGIDRNIYDTIKKFLFQNNLKYTTEWDIIYEEYVWKIKEETEKEDQ